MACPDCGNPTLWRSYFRTIHFIRMVSGSPKRYCPGCGKTWLLRSRRRFPLLQIICLALLSFLVYHAIDNLGMLRQKKDEIEAAVRRKITEQIKARYGGMNLQNLQSLQQGMSTEEKQALQEAKKTLLGK